MRFKVLVFLMGGQDVPVHGLPSILQEKGLQEKKGYHNFCAEMHLGTCGQSKLRRQLNSPNKIQQAWWIYLHLGSVGTCTVFPLLSSCLYIIIFHVKDLFIYPCCVCSDKGIFIPRQICEETILRSLCTSE